MNAKMRAKVRHKYVTDIIILIRRQSKIILNVNYFSAGLRSDSHASTGRITESTHRMSTRSRKSYHAQSSHEEQHLSRSRLHKQHEDSPAPLKAAHSYHHYLPYLLLFAVFYVRSILYCQSVY